MTLEEIAAAYIARRGLSPLNIMERNLARIIENALREDNWRVVKLSTFVTHPHNVPDDDTTTFYKVDEELA